jgi:hypothetical protein
MALTLTAETRRLGLEPPETVALTMMFEQTAAWPIELFTTRYRRC